MAQKTQALLKIAALGCIGDGPTRYRARQTVERAKQEGRIRPKPCRACGAPDVVGHHADYSRPLDLTWLCRLAITPSTH